MEIWALNLQIELEKKHTQKQQQQENTNCVNFTICLRRAVCLKYSKHIALLYRSIRIHKIELDKNDVWVEI